MDEPRRLTFRFDGGSFDSMADFEAREGVGTYREVVVRDGKTGEERVMVVRRKPQGRGEHGDA